VSKHRRLDERENQTYWLVVLFLAYTGVRFGEMAALRVSRVDLSRRRATIAESVTVVQGRGLVWGTPKSHERRQVPIPRFLVAELRPHIADKSPGDLVFTGVRGGGPLRAPIFRAGFDAAAKAIGISGLHPHELRHTAASLAIASGADVKVVQQMLGHSSAAMTMDVYGHLFTDRLDEVADALDNARAAAAKAAQESGAVVAAAQNAVAKVLPNAEVVDLAAYKAKDETAGQDAVSESAPGRIRTYASASGGRRSIP
jgi:integrase